MAQHPLVKKIKYQIAGPVFKTYMQMLKKTTQLSINGEQHLQALLDNEKAFIPCYWHQQNLGCALYLLRLVPKGLRAGFLVSPSRDGDIPAQLFDQWGAKVIRGSSSRTGAQALRDLYLIIAKDGISPANTPDGPRGPIFEFKIGPIMLAQMTGVPIVPMAYAAERAWYSRRSWDNFMLPKPYSKLAIEVGQPLYIEKNLSMTELEPLRLELQNTLINLSEQAKQVFEQSPAK